MANLMRVTGRSGKVEIRVEPQARRGLGGGRRGDIVARRELRDGRVLQQRRLGLTSAKRQWDWPTACASRPWPWRWMLSLAELCGERRRARARFCHSPCSATPCSGEKGAFRMLNGVAQSKRQTSREESEEGEEERREGPGALAVERQVTVGRATADVARGREEGAGVERTRVGRRGGDGQSDDGVVRLSRWLGRGRLLASG
ncbi:hypothetical protein HDK77DRAFT_108356 [Phyllosticta capitalensis]|uniref:uncharacterized protein n=1 Tax=Phyllosticta capitalensis TaxID=121624 RepID=UPI00312F3FFF